jgi:hypothetical protein
MLAQLRLIVANAFIAALLLLMAIDLLPTAPPALQANIQPLLTRLGLDQGPYMLFAPNPDAINTRLRAEITYRDGKQAVWRSPAWREQSAAQRWLGHRRQEWLDHMALRPDPALKPWCRYLAKSARPELENADQGAEVRLIAEEARVPPPGDGPWRTWRELPAFDDGVILSLEYLR